MMVRVTVVALAMCVTKRVPFFNIVDVPELMTTVAFVAHPGTRNFKSKSANAVAAIATVSSKGYFVSTDTRPTLDMFAFTGSMCAINTLGTVFVFFVFPA